MGHTKESVQALIEGEASESEEFACPYCPQSYESREKRDQCQASHFENTDSIPVRSQKRNQRKNLLKDWKRNSEEAEV